MKKLLVFVLVAVLFATLLPTVYAAAPIVLYTEFISYSSAGELQVKVVFSEPVNLQTDASRVMFFRSDWPGASYDGISNADSRHHIAGSSLNGNTWYPDINNKSVVIFKCWPYQPALPPATATHCYIGFSPYAGGITSISTGTAATGLHEVLFTPQTAPKLMDVIPTANGRIALKFDKPMIAPTGLDIQFVNVVNNEELQNTWKSNSITLSADRKTIYFTNDKPEHNGKINQQLREYYDGTKEMRIREAAGTPMTFYGMNGISCSLGADFYASPVSERETDAYDASLSSIWVDNHSLTKMEKANAATYLLKVDNTVQSININARPTFGTVTGTGVKTLQNDSFKTFEITVQSRNKQVTRKYYITVIKGTLPPAEVVSITTEIPKVNKSANVIVTFNIPMACEYIKDIYLGPLPLGKVEQSSATRFSTADPSLCTVIFNVNNHWGAYEWTSPVTGLTRLPIGDYTLLANDYNLKDALGRWVNVELPFRSPDFNVNLETLAVTGYTLRPVFSFEGIAYTLMVESTVTEVEIVATAADPHAMVSGDGLQPLNPGLNTFTITVTAEDGTEKEHTLTIFQAPSYPTITASMTAPLVTETELVSFTGGELRVKVTFSEPVNLPSDSSRVQFFLERTPGQEKDSITGGSAAAYICNSASGGNTWYPDTEDKRVVMFKCWPSASLLNDTSSHCYIGFSTWNGGITSIAANEKAAGMAKIQILPLPTP